MMPVFLMVLFRGIYSLNARHFFFAREICHWGMVKITYWTKKKELVGHFNFNCLPYFVDISLLKSLSL
jgi:hypothetical protein